MDINMENKKILIVDDEPAMIDIYARELQDAGYEVSIATNGKEAIEFAASKKPDLIVMDVKMPEMDGVEATHQIKDNPETKEIKVVFLSAFGDPDAIATDKKYAQEMGALDFIQKGIGLKEFTDKIKTFI